MRVALDGSAVPHPAGGAGRYVLELARALSERDDVDLTVVARRGDGSRWPSPVADRAPSPRPLRLAWEQAALPRLLSGLAVDVHHAPHYTMPAAARVPVVVTVHDLSFFSHPEWHHRSKVALFRSAIRLAAAKADALVAVSAATAERLARYARPRAPVSVIPHGVDHARFRPSAGPGEEAADAVVLRSLGVTRPYVAFVGTLEPRKDVPTLVRAFDRIAGRWPDLTLVLAGARAWGAAAVDEAVRGAASPGRVRALGFVDDRDLPTLLRAAAAVAYPSLEEGFGLPALEALACGAPLVTTTGSAMEEVAGPASYLVGVGDVDALAEALEAAIAAGPDRAERRRRGLEIAARHTWPASAAAHAEVYRSLT